MITTRPGRDFLCITLTPVAGFLKTGSPVSPQERRIWDQAVSESELGVDTEQDRLWDGMKTRQWWEFRNPECSEQVLRIHPERQERRRIGALLPAPTPVHAGDSATLTETIQSSTDPGLPVLVPADLNTCLQNTALISVNTLC